MAVGSNDLPSRWPWSMGAPRRRESQDDYNTHHGFANPGNQTPPTSQPTQDNQLGSVFSLLNLNQPRMPRRTFSGDEIQGWHSNKISRNPSELNLDSMVAEHPNGNTHSGLASGVHSPIIPGTPTSAGGPGALPLRRGSVRNPPRRQMSGIYDPAFIPRAAAMHPRSDPEPVESSFSLQPNSPFLMLPAELRLLVYKELVNALPVPEIRFQSHCLNLRPSREGLGHFDEMRKNLQSLVMVSRVCKQVMSEMAPFLLDEMEKGRLRITVEAHFYDKRELLERVRLARGVEWKLGAVELEKFIDYTKLPTPPRSGRLDATAVDEYLLNGGDPDGVVPSSYSYGILPDGKIDPETGDWYPLAPESYSWAA